MIGEYYQKTRAKMTSSWVIALSLTFHPDELACLVSLVLLNDWACPRRNDVMRAASTCVLYHVPQHRLLESDYQK